MKPNLARLLSNNVNPSVVQRFLNIIFPHVITERRQETFFNFQFRCYDEERNLRLTIRYGWSAAKEMWFFEPIPVRKDK
jgi:hypothetical protein